VEQEAQLDQAAIGVTLPRIGLNQLEQNEIRHGAYIQP
jgi:hypothetical protein